MVCGVLCAVRDVRCMVCVLCDVVCGMCGVCHVLCMICGYVEHCVVFRVCCVLY